MERPRPRADGLLPSAKPTPSVPHPRQPSPMAGFPTKEKAGARSGEPVHATHQCPAPAISRGDRDGNAEAGGLAGTRFALASGQLLGAGPNKARCVPPPSFHELMARFCEKEPVEWRTTARPQFVKIANLRLPPCTTESTTSPNADRLPDHPTFQAKPVSDPRIPGPSIPKPREPMPSTPLHHLPSTIPIRRPSDPHPHPSPHN